MRGRFFIAVLALAAFLASFGAPLEPLFAASMSCCPSGKAAACCKRHRGGAGWNANALRCGGSCACTAPASDAPAVAAATAGATFVVARRAIARPDSPNAPSSYQAFLFQRPPPPCV